ncbi:MAG: HupE/UreJ family protein [Janthinobacterium lividum]
MMLKVFAVAAMCLLLGGRTAWAHRIDEYLQATILSLETHRVNASLRLIPGVLIAPSVIAGIDTNHDGVFSEIETKRYAELVLNELAIVSDGTSAKAQLDLWSVPGASQLRDGLGEITIQYHVDLPAANTVERSFVLANHHLNAGSVYLVNVEVPQESTLRIVDQKRNPQQSLYELDYIQSGLAAGSSTPHSGFAMWLDRFQFLSLFRLGMQHIAEGTDHLLFLLVLLLPAPLLAVGSRWQGTAGIRRSLLRIVGIVTAFTIGHSLTLTLAAMNVVHVPSQPVEALIALSILISAVHALRPIFPGREAWIAAFFGLIHGLAFATTLDRLGLSHWDRVAGILSFNLGVEAMQMLVVVLVLPSLLLMSRTRAYPALRVVGAILAGIASSGWIAERVFGVQTEVDRVVNGVARTGIWGAVALFTMSLLATYGPVFREYVASDNGSRN